MPFRNPLLDRIVTACQMPVPYPLLLFLHFECSTPTKSPLCIIVNQAIADGSET